MEKKRSFGVIVFGILLILIGVRNLVFLWFFKNLHWVEKIFQSLLIVFFNCYCGINILLLKSWARTIFIFMSILLIPLSILGYIFFPFNIWILLNVPFSLAIIYFFTRPKVKEQFE